VIETRGATGPFALPEFPAVGNHVPKERVHPSGLLDAEYEIVEMVLKQMLKHARRNGHTQVVVWRGTSANDERPHRFWFRFDELAHLDESLPPWVDLSLRRPPAGKNRLGCNDCGLNSHNFRSG
jgi:hypothetical protein